MTTTFNQLVNNAIGTVQNNPLTAGGTNLIVNAALDTKLSGLTFPFILTMWAAGLTPDTDSVVEVVKVTARVSPNNYTIVRAQESTSASAHAQNDNVGLLWTTGDVTQITTAINNLETNIPINIQNQTYSYAADSGAANAYVITLSPAVTAYAAGQRFSFKATNANTTASTLNVNGLGVKNIKKTGASLSLVANDILAGQIVDVEYDGTQFQMQSLTGNAAVVATFGGTGADGALAISSGTTTISLASAAVVVKNYTSISITGTGVLAFSNVNTNGTIIILKSQGNVTLTSSATPMINCSGTGAAGGAAAAAGSDAVSNLSYSSKKGATSSGATPGAGGVGNGSLDMYTQAIQGKFIRLSCGAGGAGGGTNGGATGGVGGAGGGALYIECAGALNFTTASGISVKGVNGSNGVDGGAGAGGGGGGGGGGGSCVILYNTLTSASGTVTFTGGTGGTGGATGGGTGGTAGSGTGTSSGGTGGARAGAAGGSGGGGGASDVFGGAGGTGGDGGASSAGGGGGGGAAGFSLITSNTVFV